MAQIDQALIDYAVAHGYTREEAIAHYGKQQSSDSPSADWALKQGQQNVADQPAALEKLKEPDVKGAVTEMVPAAANTAKEAATSAFQGLDSTSAAIGAGAGAIGYGLYKTLANKMTGGSPTPPPPPPPVVQPSPTAPATPAAPVVAPATSAPSGIANLQQRLGIVPTAPAPVLSPEEVRQQKLTAAGNAAQQEMKAVAPVSAEGAAPLIPAPPAPTDTPPVKVEPPPVAPPPAPVSAAQTSAEVVTNPVATPVEKAVTLTQEAPAVVPPPKAPRAERGSLATIANNPAPVEGMPGMRENYTKPKGINPVTGEPFIGPGGYNWLANQVGHDVAPQVWQEQYGQRNVPHAQVQADYSATRYPPTAVTVEGQSGGAFGKPKYIPDYIRGSASPAALATTALAAALPALGVAAVKKYQGNEAAVNASLQDAKDSLKSLATMPYDVSKAALKGDFGPLKDLMLSLNPGSLLFNEMNKNDEEIIKKMIQKEKVGAGRGMQGVPPPTR